MEDYTAVRKRSSRLALPVLAWFRLTHVFQKVDQLSAEHLRGWGLSVAQFDMLAQVGAAEGATQQQVAEALLVTKGNICQLVDRMERDGLLRRCQAGRTNQLFLTEAGRNLYNKVIPAQEALITRVFSALSNDDQAQLQLLLRTVDHSLRNFSLVGETYMTTQDEPSTITWVIDQSHSSVEFAIKHMMFSTVKGRFASFSGTIVEHSTDLSLSSVDVTINVVSIDTHEEKRDEHLRSGDFFLAEEHPTITFKSTRVQPVNAERFNVIGDLTIRGVTRSVNLEVTKTGTGTNPWGSQVAGFSAETQISRKDFGLVYNVALETGGVLVGDNVKISLEIEATKQA
ncbi:MAG: YceI family protein [Gemmatimonadales bacterium]|nr:YceI family protein [Gemmatimonadales bacterium]